jgi:hypothetical protein
MNCRTGRLSAALVMGAVLVTACGSSDSPDAAASDTIATGEAVTTPVSGAVTTPQTTPAPAPAVAGGACSSPDTVVSFDASTDLVCMLDGSELRWVEQAAAGGPVATDAPGCKYNSYPPVEAPLESAAGAFTHVPFEPADLALITNGAETNDARFSYQWIKDRGAEVPIYAPADGVLVRIRHKPFVEGVFESDDFDLFFLVDCTTLVRFNHITSPRDDIRATYQFGDEPSVVFNADGTYTEYDDRQQPSENIYVEAGELLGHTSGTPQANDFDFSIAVDNATVCPFSVFEEPVKTELLSMLGPQTASPFGPPEPGYECTGYGNAP